MGPGAPGAVLPAPLAVRDPICVEERKEYKALCVFVCVCVCTACVSLTPSAWCCPLLQLASLDPTLLRMLGWSSIVLGEQTEH